MASSGASRVYIRFAMADSPSTPLGEAAVLPSRGNRRSRSVIVGLSSLEQLLCHVVSTVVHSMYCWSFRRVVVADEELDGSDMVRELRGKWPCLTHEAGHPLSQSSSRDV